MKYLITLFVGLLLGAAIFCIGLIYNPFANKLELSPLAVTDAQTITLSYPVVASESIAYTNNGESPTSPFPEKVLQLWEAPIRKTSARVTTMLDGRRQAVGFGIKISSFSKETRPFEGKALVDSVWYVYLPGRGGLFVAQTENYWDYLRAIVLPAYRSSSDTWKGAWLGNLSAGPGALGTARVSGSSGEFAGKEMLAVESQNVRAWRVTGGPAAADGQLLIELPPAEVASDEALADDLGPELP